MRYDMSKVLVERPRAGHKNGEATSRHARRTHKQELRFTGGGDDFNVGFGNTESITAHTKGHPKRSPKELNENLKPLRRFLRSRVGKPWDKVYSEIMEGINLNNAVQYHVWQHLVQFGEVETKTYMEGNTVMIAGGSPRHVGDYSWREEFYVHPKTGLLCVSKSDKKRYKWNRNQEVEALNETRYIDAKHPLNQYHKIDGIWYEIQLRRPTEDELAKQQFGYFRPRMDPVSYKLRYDWERTEDHALTGQIQMNRRVTGYLYRQSALWETCKVLFGEALLPLRKQQIGTAKIRQIENAMASRKWKKAA